MLICVDLCRSVSFLVSEHDALRLDLIPFHTAILIHTVQSHRFTESFAVCLLKELAHGRSIEQGLDVVWNALLAPFILKEKLTRPGTWPSKLKRHDVAT